MAAEPSSESWARSHLVPPQPAPLDLQAQIRQLQARIQGLEGRVLALEHLDRRSWLERSWLAFREWIWKKRHGL